LEAHPARGERSAPSVQHAAEAKCSRFWVLAAARMLAETPVMLALRVLVLGSLLTLGVGCSKSTPQESPAPTPSAEPPPSATAAPSASSASEETPAPSASVALPEPTASAKPVASAKSAGAHPSASANAPERVVKTVSGTSASSDAFAVGISAQSPVHAGQSGTANVILTAKDPYHCNPKYPYKFALDAPSGGVSYPSNPVRGMSVTEKRSSMSVPFSAADKGHVTVSGTLFFSICTADKCLLDKRPLSVGIDVD
jgi:hypothetical protein